jgi:hypothetical protein
VNGPYQDGAPNAFGLADHVEELVGSVGEVDVRYSGRAEDVAVAHSWAFVRVACGVLGTVGFGLDDHARGEAFGRVVGDDATE